MFSKTHFVGYLGYISIGITNTIIGPAVPHLIDEYGMSFSIVGALFFVQWTCYFVSVLLSGGCIRFLWEKTFSPYWYIINGNGFDRFFWVKMKLSFFYL